MVRPRLCRRVCFEPNVIYFKPAGIPMHNLEEVVLQIDELEAIRLKDCSGFEQEECAKRMEISQPTFHRLITTARRKVADSILHGKALRIQGGNVDINKKREGCNGGK